MMIGPEMWYDKYVKGMNKCEQLKILKELDDKIKDLLIKKVPRQYNNQPKPRSTN